MKLIESCHMSGCMCDICQPPDPGYTAGKNYMLEGNRPILADDSTLNNSGSTNNALESGLNVRQPI